MPARKADEFRLEVGKAVIGIICPDKEYADSFSDYFGTPHSEKNPDVTLTLNLVNHEDDISIPDSLFTTKSVAGKTIHFADDIVVGTIGQGPDEIELSVKIMLTHASVTRVFEQLLYQAFYSACGIISYDSLLLHSSGVIYRGDGFLFTGPSGTGKSTIASLSRSHHVINDEICLLEFNDGGGITLRGTPYNGNFKDKKSGSAPLKAIFLLGHGTAHSIKSIEKGRAIPTLAKEIIPPVALHENFSPSIFIRMLDMAERAYSMVPVYRLEFLPDSGFWAAIDDLYRR